MSARSHAGQKRARPDTHVNGAQSRKYAKSSPTAGTVKRDQPPLWGKKTNQKPFSHDETRDAQQEEVKRRKRPISAGGGEVDLDADEEATEVEAMEADREEEDPDQSVEKRPRMSKTERAELHAAQPHRTALLPSHPLLQDKLLPLWETARRADLSKAERSKAVAELWDSVKGRVVEISRGHKGGRVLQTVGHPS